MVRIERARGNFRTIVWTLVVTTALVTGLLATVSHVGLGAVAGSVPYPSGCPTPGSGRQPLLTGRIAVDSSGSIHFFRRASLTCPQFAGTLSVVPGSLINFRVRSISLSSDPRHIHRHVLLPAGSTGEFARPGKVFRVRDVGTVIITTPQFTLTIVSSYPTS